MEELKLVIPTSQDEDAVMSYRHDVLAAGLPMSVGFSLRDIDEYNDWLTHIKVLANAPDKQSHYIVYRAADNKLIGLLIIRHSLNNPMLYKYSGNIGCHVAPSERHKGYGTKMLNIGLDICRKLGLNETLMICADDNIASKKCIEKCGGELKQKVPLDNGVIQCRYIIKL